MPANKGGCGQQAMGCLVIIGLSIGGLIWWAGHERAAPAKTTTPVVTPAPSPPVLPNPQPPFHAEPNPQAVAPPFGVQESGSWLGVLCEDAATFQGIVLPKGVVMLKTGAVVKRIADNSPAHQAGIQKNDFIMKIDNERIKSVDDMQKWLDAAEPETDHVVNVAHLDGHWQYKNLRVRLAKNPGQATIARIFEDQRIAEERVEAERAAKLAKEVQERRQRTDGAGYAGYTFAKKLIPAALKAPKTAQFDYDTVSVEVAPTWIDKYGKKADCWRVRGSVDAQNSFGALVREWWEIEVAFEGGEYFPTVVKLENREVLRLTNDR